MTVEISKSYTNQTGNYQVVCNTQIVVFQGSAEEAQSYLDNTADLTTKYTDATIAAPGETLTGNYVAPEQYKDAATRQMSNDFLSAFFDPEDLS